MICLCSRWEIFVWVDSCFKCNCCNVRWAEVGGAAELVVGDAALGLVVECNAVQVLNGEDGVADVVAEFVGLVEGGTVIAWDVAGDERRQVGEVESSTVCTNRVHAEIEGVGFLPVVS